VAHGVGTSASPTPELFIQHMLEVRRVLRNDATCWINIGNPYAAQGGFGIGGNAARKGRANQQHNVRPNRPADEAKDLLSRRSTS
jgi:site-specific DNA-methyltransferase (cytosine-N4-specific)